MSMDTVIVTGSSTGLGLETSLFLAERGMRVYATAQDEAACETVIEESRKRGVALHARVLDIVDPESVSSTVESIAAEAGGVFGLVNNAGLGLRGCFEDLTEREIRRVFEANVFGTMSVTQRVLPHMRAAGRGRVVTISSVGGRISTFGLSAYCATKFAQEGFAEALALELAPFGLHSILVEPGIILTPRWTTNRGTAEHALDADSPYAEFFRRHEEFSDKWAQRSRNRPIHVARVIHRALTDRKPRLRYIVGRPAKIAVAMRRVLPDRFFERLYFGSLLRRIQARDAKAARELVAAAAQHP
jgi:NAD(P)-dependent dehydrogenase (short-subunit alcohol dehydrogenase family)